MHSEYFFLKNTLKSLYFSSITLGEYPILKKKEFLGLGISACNGGGQKFYIHACIIILHKYDFYYYSYLIFFTLFLDFSQHSVSFP